MRDLSRIRGPRATWAKVETEEASHGEVASPPLPNRCQENRTSEEGGRWTNGLGYRPQPLESRKPKPLGGLLCPPAPARPFPNLLSPLLSIPPVGCCQAKTRDFRA